MSVIQKKFRIEGIAPLIMHNGQTRDPLNPFSKAMKSITSKRKKTDEDYKTLSDLEWKAGLYVNEEKKVIIPAINLEACIINGAKKSKLGESFKAALYVEGDAILDYDGPKDISALEKDMNHRLTVGVKVNRGSAIMRTRPIFKTWAVTFTVSYADDVINPEQIISAIKDAGRLVGLGDWTPRHGRFVLVE